MHTRLLFLLLCIPTLLHAQKRQTHPYVGLGGHVSTLLGQEIETTAQPGGQAILGMWAFSDKRTEWQTEIGYQLLRGTVEGYQVEDLAIQDSGTYAFLAHTLRWTTMISWYPSPRKEGLTLQAGAYIGVGAGGRADQPDVRYGIEWSFIMQDLYMRGSPHVGLILGIGGGTRVIQGRLHGVWDTRSYSRVAGVPVRRPMIQASLIFLLRDFVIF